MGETALKGRTLSSCMVGGILLVIHAGVAASDKEAQAMADAEAELPLQGSAGHGRSALAGPLCGPERRALSDAWTRRVGACSPWPVVTTSRFDRAAITAMNWFVRNAMKAFTPEEILPAMRYLGVMSTVTTQAIVDRARRVAADLGGPPLISMPASHRNSAWRRASLDESDASFTGSGSARWSRGGPRTGGGLGLEGVCEPPGRRGERCRRPARSL